MPLDQSSEARLHEEMDMVRREGRDRDDRVSRLERRIMQIGGIVLGWSCWAVALIALASWTFRDFYRSPR
jgi:uncharacterized membrane protein